MSNTLVKSLYGSFFALVVPALLVLWANGLGDAVSGFPAAGTPAMGVMLVALGVCSIVAGWVALIQYGRGLPMNAFPPEVLVQQGIYSLTPHPIYTGFTVLMAGYFMLVGSGAGFWLVTPCVAMGSVALVLGYERQDMQKRFGRTKWPTLLHLPEANDTMPSASDRASPYVLVFLPWLAVYSSAIVLGPAPDSVESYFPFEYSLPVIEWTEAVYASCYFFVLAAPLIARRKCDLRRFMLMGLRATVAGGLCFLLLPLMATPRPFEASGVWGRLLLERSVDGPAAAFPAFHVIWALLAAWLYGRSLPAKPLWYTYASAIALSCLTTGMHSLTDIAGALCVLALALNGERLWRWALHTTERMANSWRDWRIGRVRIIVHGVYAGAGAFVGVVLVSHLTGAAQVGYVLFVSLAALLGAGLWGKRSRAHRSSRAHSGITERFLAARQAYWQPPPWERTAGSWPGPSL